MTQEARFNWVQGEDLTIELIYKEGSTTENAVPVDLSSDYALRMDIVDPEIGRLYTFNSDAVADVDEETSGSQPDLDTEVEFGNGTAGSPNVSITVPRHLALPGGPLHGLIDYDHPVAVLFCDIFLRNTASDRQARILKAVISLEKSNTLWS